MQSSLRDVTLLSTSPIWYQVQTIDDLLSFLFLFGKTFEIAGNFAAAKNNYDRGVGRF